LHPLIVLFIAVNVLTFFLYALDKRKATKSKWRISEKTLIFFTLAFGGIGAVGGMCLANHKTRSLKFKLAAALGLIIAVVAVIYLFSFSNGTNGQVAVIIPTFPMTLNGLEFPKNLCMKYL